MLYSFFIATVITLPAMVLMRWILGRRIANLMLRKSPKSAVPPPRVEEVPAATVPSLKVLDVASAAANSDAARLDWMKDGRRRFFRWWVAELAGAGLVLVIAVLVHDTSVFFALDSDLTAALGVYASIAAYLVIVSLRHLFYRRFYRGGAIRAAKRAGFFRRWITMLFEEVFRLFFAPKRQAQVFWIFVILVLWFSSDKLAFLERALPVAAGLAVHLWLRSRPARKAQNGANRRLLILRVFGRNENADLTFGALRTFWQHIGSSFTVVDRSFIGFKYRGHSETHVTILFLAIALPTIFIAVVQGEAPTTEVFVYLGVSIGALILVGYFIAAVVLYIRAPVYFATDRPHIRRMIERVLRRPVRRSLTFRDLDMYCFDNTWRDAVAEFAATSDIVLMDLRGYSDENKGCEFEVDFLFDTVPVDHIVFLIDSASDLELVERLVIQRWEHLSTGSPNLKMPDPVVTLFQSQNNKAGDVRGLVNVMSARIRQSEQFAEAALSQWNDGDGGARQPQAIALAAGMILSV